MLEYLEMKCHNTFNLLSNGKQEKGRNERREKGRQGGWEEREGRKERVREKERAKTGS